MLRELGVHAERSPAQPPGAGPGRGSGGAPYDCFTDPAGDEICLGGRKLAGSAQRRGAGAFLQHGSIRLQPDPVEATRAAGLGSGGATSLAEQGHPIAPDTLGDALARAFARVLGVELERSALADEERVLATARGEEPAPPTLMSRPTPGP